MASNNLSPAEVNALYSGVYGPANDARMQAMQTPEQIYQGMYPVAGSTSATKAINQAVPVQTNFYNATGVPQSYVNTIGQPLSASVDQTGQRIVGGPTIDPSAPKDNWNGDPAYVAYLAQQAAQQAAPTAVAQQNTDWSKANPGSTGLFGFPMSPNQRPQNAPTVRLPMMASSAVAPVGAAPGAAPVAVQAPMPIMASTNGYTYSPNAAGGYTRVGQVNPSLTPAQVYAAANAGNTASYSSNPSWYPTNNGGGGGGSLAGN